MASVISVILWGLFIDYVVVTYVLSGCVGFFLCGYLGLMIRVCVVYNLRLSEAITTMIFYFFAMVFTIGFVEVFLYVGVLEIPSIWAAAGLNTVISLTLIFLLFQFNKKKKVFDSSSIKGLNK